MLEFKKPDSIENIDNDPKKSDSPEIQNDLKKILNDINQILIRIANRNSESAKSIMQNLDMLEAAMQNTPDNKEEIELLLMRIQLQIQHHSNLFGSHETSASHFCAYLINKIDEFLNA